MQVCGLAQGQAWDQVRGLWQLGAAIAEAGLELRRGVAAAGSEVLWACCEELGWMVHSTA